MSKIQLFCLSLVGALPAAYLSFLLGMYLISQPSGASTMVMIISIITLLCTATLTVIPVLVMTMYYSNYDPPRPAKVAKDKGKAKGKADKDEDEESDESPKGKSGDQIEELSSSDELVAEDDGEILEMEDE